MTSDTNRARRHCGMALTYLAIIKDNLNELNLRIDYAESNGTDVSRETETVKMYLNALKSLADFKQGL